jgi:hypothetical protein
MLDRDVAGVVLGHVGKVCHDLTAQIHAVLTAANCLANNSQPAFFILMNVDREA